MIGSRINGCRLAVILMLLAGAGLPACSSAPKPIIPAPQMIGKHYATRAQLAAVGDSLRATIDAYGALDPPERKPVDEALAGSGWEALLAYEPRHRLGKRRFQLVFEPSASRGGR